MKLNEVQKLELVVKELKRKVEIQGDKILRLEKEVKGLNKWNLMHI